MNIRFALLISALASISGAAGAAPLTTAYEDDGMVTVNGKRTFIIGSYHYDVKQPEPPSREQLLREAAAMGFNLVRAGQSREELDALEAAGLMGWVTVGVLDLDKRQESEELLREKLDEIKERPALAFLETRDEPAWTWREAGARISAETFAQTYPIFREVDPRHLIYTNHAPVNLVKNLQAYNAGTDIVAMDIYPVSPGGLRPMFALFDDGCQGDLNNNTISQVGEYVDKMRRVAGPHRPLFMVLQAFAWEMLRDEPERDPSKVLYPTFHESRFMAFQSIIKGANGILYWGSRHTPLDAPFRADWKRVIQEIKALAGPLAARRAPVGVQVDYYETGHSVDDGVQFLAKEHNGRLFLMTCNADRYPCKASLSGLGAWTTCAVRNEDRELPVVEGTITDMWEAFDVHVYELSR